MASGQSREYELRYEALPSFYSSMRIKIHNELDSIISTCRVVPKRDCDHPPIIESFVYFSRQFS